MSESETRSKIVAALKPLHAVPVENVVGAAGAPDINFVGGWIEVKRLNHWPARINTVVKLTHPYTLPQKRWAQARRNAGGKVWVILHAENEWLLFTSEVATDVFDTMTAEQLRQAAVKCWDSYADFERDIAGILS